MQGNIDSVHRLRRLAVHPAIVQERVKRGGRVRIHESLSQPGLANNVSRLIFFLVPGITETRFPVPCLEVIAKFAHLTAKSHIKENVVKRGRRKSVTHFQGAIGNPGIYRGSGKGLAVRRNSRVRYREWIRRSGEWHTDAEWTKARACYRAGECIGHKRRRRRIGTEIGASVLEVGKQRQVLVANVARQRPIINLTISPRNRRRQSREIEKREVAIRKRNVGGILR